MAYCIIKRLQERRKLPDMNKEELEQRRVRAVKAAHDATAALEALGVQVVVTGSLARGEFSCHSDIDLLVTECPRQLKYAIEGLVEDTMAGMPFDVIYASELPEWKLARFMAGSVHASQLR